MLSLATHKPYFIHDVYDPSVFRSAQQQRQCFVNYRYQRESEGTFQHGCHATGYCCYHAKLKYCQIIEVECITPQKFVYRQIVVVSLLHVSASQRRTVTAEHRRLFLWHGDSAVYHVIKG
jgi:hypothetical protein